MSNEKKPCGYWTKEKCHEVALLCESRSEFMKKYISAYSRAHKGKFIDEICSHMIQICKPIGYWTKEKCLEVSIKCKSRSEFQKTNATAYNSASKNMFLDEICSHMISDSKPFKYWTKEKCIEVAQTCISRSEFRKKYAGGYDAVLEKSWSEDVFRHMVEITKPVGYWTKEKCLEVSMLYTNKKEFRLNNGGAYAFAYKNGFLNEICLHMIPLGNYSNRWVYSATFPDGSIYFGLTYDYNKRWEAHKTKGSVYEYSIKSNTVPKFELIVPNLLPVKDALDLEYNLINEYRLNNYNVLNRVNGGNHLGISPTKWTFDKCKTEAAKFQHKSDFKHKSSAYQIARKNNWLNDICNHMIPKVTPKGYWNNYENCQVESLLYNSLYELFQNSPHCHKAIIRNSWQDLLYPNENLNLFITKQ